MFFLSFYFVGAFSSIAFSNCEIGSQCGKVLTSPNGRYVLEVIEEKGETEFSLKHSNNNQDITKWKTNDTFDTLEFSPDNSEKVLVGNQNSFSVYDFKNKKPLRIHSQKNSQNLPIVNTTFSKDGKKVYWSDPYHVYKDDLFKKNTQEIASLKNSKTPIHSLTTLDKDKLLISLEDQTDFYLFSPQNKTSLTPLKKHIEPVVGTQTTNGNHFLSLDKRSNLIFWDGNTKQPTRTVSLSKTLESVGFSLDSKKKNVWVLFKNKEGLLQGRTYPLPQLRSGKGYFSNKQLLQSSSGSIYSSLSKPINPPNYYKLASIEAETNNYYAALDFIKKVPLHSKDYRASRKLKQRIYQRISANNELNVALKLYEKGNLEEAKKRFQTILELSPTNKIAKKKIQEIEENEFLHHLLNWILWIFLFAFILLALWNLKIYLQKNSINNSNKKSKNDSSNQILKKDSSLVKKSKNNNIKDNKSKHQFDSNLATAKNILQTAILGDKNKELEQKWKILEQQILDIEKEAENKKNFATQTKKLIQLQKIIQELQQEQTRKVPLLSNKETKKDYYQILGVARSATSDIIKTAYRKKIKEVHPDLKHNSDKQSEKEDASEQTQIIQKAYETLRDVKLRMEYNEHLRFKEEK